MMSSLICLLLIVAVVQTIVAEGNTSNGIPTIMFRQIRHFNGGFAVKWDPIKNVNESDPIIGVKVIVWRTPCEIYNDYEYEGDQLMKIVKSRHQIFYYQEVPQEKPDNVVIAKPDELTARVENIDVEVWYHVRLLAFTKTAEGPYSIASNFKTTSTDEKDKDKACDRIISKHPINEHITSKR